ncbi:transporter [Galbibacter sp. BG1]|uniref:transporter n=1 Tax=Galbibacter sp. BG1 TaxID=1170699 RepID=UPI0015B88AD6|nr:transporter [Galbibacter sp. BG1]QLE00194.1 transporter [Galbibacter sp. BG1]
MQRDLKENIIFGLCMCCFFNVTGQSNRVSQFQTGAYIPALIGVRDLSTPENSGFLITNYNALLFSNTFYDAEGNSISSGSLQGGELNFSSIDVQAYNNTFDVTYVSPEINFLKGLRYLFFIDIPYNTANLQIAATEVLRRPGSVRGGSAGFSDITISPITLSYSFEKMDVTGGYTFVAPTGSYQTGSDNNTGLGYWSHLFQLGMYYYLNEKSTAFLISPTYEFHGQLKDADVTVGDRFSVEYGISQYLSERFEVTFQGGHVWQIGEDRGSEVYWNTSVKDRSSIVSAGAGYWFLGNSVYGHLKWLSSYGNRQFFQFNGIEFQILFVI